MTVDSLNIGYSFRLIRWTPENDQRLIDYKVKGGMRPLFFHLDIHHPNSVYDTEENAVANALAALTLFPDANYAVIDLWERDVVPEYEHVEDLYIIDDRGEHVDNEYSKQLNGL